MAAEVVWVTVFGNLRRAGSPGVYHRVRDCHLRPTTVRIPTVREAVEELGMVACKRGACGEDEDDG